MSKQRTLLSMFGRRPPDEGEANQSGSSNSQFVSDADPMSQINPDPTSSQPSIPVVTIPLSEPPPHQMLPAMPTDHLPVISRPQLEKYPKNSQKRSFQAKWYTTRKWLEYILESDSCFCYPCKVFNALRDGVFISTGFNNWKMALASGKGFDKHEKSDSHIDCMKMWFERLHRDQTDTTVSNLIAKPNTEHRTWLFCVFETVRVLVKQGLPLRGDKESTNFESGVEGGNFLSLLNDYAFKLRPELLTIAKRLPENAKYTSPDVQNEVIGILAKMVKKTIADGCNRAGAFTLLMDGTEDSNGIEMEAVVLRFWDGSNVAEHVINIEPAFDRSAKGLMAILVDTLKKNGISFDGLTSDCFDGAAVNSGWKGGLQALLTEKCGRFVLFIHCVNHRLFLVIKKILVKKNDNEDDTDSVIGTVETVRSEVQEFFVVVGDLYTFFKLHEVKELYSGKLTLKRLITTRWSGHLAAVQVFIFLLYLKFLC